MERFVGVVELRDLCFSPTEEGLQDRASQLQDDFEDKLMEGSSELHELDLAVKESKSEKAAIEKRVQDLTAELASLAEAPQSEDKEERKDRLESAKENSSV